MARISLILKNWHYNEERKKRQFDLMQNICESWKFGWNRMGNFLSLRRDKPNWVWKVCVREYSGVPNSPILATIGLESIWRRVAKLE
jgi:hypothetical protein